MWKWVFFGGLGLIIIATIVSLGKLETVEPDHQGVVIRNGDVLKTLPPGRHFLFSSRDRVIQISTAPVKVTNQRYRARTALDHTCVYRVNHTYAMVDPVPSARRYLARSKPMERFDDIRDMVLDTVTAYSKSVIGLDLTRRRRTNSKRISKSGSGKPLVTGPSF